MKRPRLIFTGGYLGAGKTTLLQQAIRSPLLKGKTIGLITNDQSDSLVDTRFLSKVNNLVLEVGGSCFCCNYNGLFEAIDKLTQRHNAPDIIFAEPVGSCTDISATILQPLKEQNAVELQLAPFTVLAEPRKLFHILDGNNAGMHPSAAYIYRKQLEESDMIVISKSDLLSSPQLEILTEKLGLFFADREIISLSAKENTGIEKWLKLVLENRPAGRHIVDVDYEIYAEGEAVLGWLNASVFLQGKNEDWNLLLEKFFLKLNDQLGPGHKIHHVKVMIEDAGGKYIIGNQTGDKDTIELRNKISNSDLAQITINARVEISPQKLQQMIFETLKLTLNRNVFYEIRFIKSISPGYPSPTNRYHYVV